MIVPGVDVISLFDRVIKAYEDDLLQFSFTVTVVNDKERVYNIQDTSIVYLGLVNMSYTDSIQYTIVFEELLNNESFDFNASAFKRKFNSLDRLAIEYVKFHGVWAKPLREVDESQYRNVKPYKDRVDFAGAHFYVPSKAEYINEQLPELHLKERYNNWEGFLFHYIFYEYARNNEVGYALFCTNNPRVHKIARDRVKEIEKRGGEFLFALQRRNPSLTDADFVRSIYGPGAMVQSGVNCDKKMIELLELRYNEWQSLSEEEKKKRKSCFRFANGEINYFYIPKLIKSDIHSDLSKVGTSLFIDVHEGKYSDLDRYNYVSPVYKWKSEQIVFELTQIAFKNHRVIYQHRPSFLKTNSGQMSYDVFICGINVAIEYQGKQHFEPVEIFGGEKHFAEQKRRDELKRELSIKNKVTLVYINYWDDISADLIRERVNSAMQISK